MGNQKGLMFVIRGRDMSKTDESRITSPETLKLMNIHYFTINRSLIFLYFGRF